MATGAAAAGSGEGMGEEEAALPARQEVLHDFSGYLDDRETADIVFWVGGQPIHAHRIVLLCSRASDVFRAMLR